MAVNIIMNNNRINQSLYLFIKKLSIKILEKAGIKMPGITRSSPVKTQNSSAPQEPASRDLREINILGFLPEGLKFSFFSNVKTIPVKPSSNSSILIFRGPEAGSLI